MSEQKLSDLSERGTFVGRHIGPGDNDIAVMLKTLGEDSLDALIDGTVPKQIRSKRPLSLHKGLGESDSLARMAEFASHNKVNRSYIGMGYYGTVMPSVIVRNLFENPGWYTAYTPYQAEISQGRLEAVLNFQQMVIDLTGMDIANASLLDEATAAAEAMSMAKRVAKNRSARFFVDQDTHPQTIAVIRTRAHYLGIEVIVGDPASDLDASNIFGILLSYPGSSGEIRDDRAIIEAVHNAKGIVSVASDLLALCLLTPPGEWGADIVLGSSQRFGVPMGYGGPHAAFFATREKHKRSIPGRIIGVSVDTHGKPALRMALQTREQHIRRDKANSNICTAQVLLAVIAGMYAVYHGADGVTRTASRVHRLTRALAKGLSDAGVHIVNERFFDTLTIELEDRATAVLEGARAAGINLREIDGDHIGVSLDETTSIEDVQELVSLLTGGSDDFDVNAADRMSPSIIDGDFKRISPFMTHPVFGSCRSETEMMRYLRRLQRLDLALDRAMIPLGSCTMKLNAATEMVPVSWPEINGLHPFVPIDQARGYQELIDELEAWLAEITGFDAVNFQPNAGSQGEYTGLLAIRAFHESRGQGGRDVCLIPSSAHGTNPASAVMAGMRVVVVGCDDHGNIDLDDLQSKASEHNSELAALMVTYPSTHGVFEETIREICDIIHSHGGQVYMDGANLNALVGLAQPGDLGADVSHLNLHKTFCIPHGGGGPGMGPIGVKQHLRPFLPTHPLVVGDKLSKSVGTVSAAAYGSPSILPISWSYIAMMGGEGLTKATKVAILNANYIATRLKPHYSIVYTGANGRIAHECIIDFRDIKEATGITSEDVAKRLVDYGFHAPTMSWPVPETMMIEPTESEPLSELDRFCQAMISIRDEIREIENGTADRADNVLKHSPHTADLLIGEWPRPYSKEQAFYPPGSQPEDKYWPPVGRVDNVYGDRHLVCTCPPLEAYQQAAE